MIAEHFTRRWQNAGLIDGDTASRVVAWEAAHRRPVWLWAVAGMGTLAIALGIMAIVGANWESIPAWAKLTIDLGLNGLAAAAVLVCWRTGRVWLADLAALLLFGLVLSGIALIGQVYQLQSEPWHALVLWLALCTPFLAFTALSRLTGTIWALAVATTWFAAEEPVGWLLVRLGVLHDGQSSDTTLALAYLLACGLIVVAILRGLWPPAGRQADLLLRLAFAGLILECSVAMVIRLPVGGDDMVLGPIVAAALATLLAGFVGWIGYRRRPGRFVILGLLGMNFVAWTIAALISNSSQPTTMSVDIERALLFIVYWAVLGAMAARGGWRGIFGLSFTLIGLRLLVVYFEAIGGLTATGFGLLGGGAICLILAGIGWRLTRSIGRTAAATGAAP